MKVVWADDLAILCYLLVNLILQVHRQLLDVLLLLGSRVSEATLILELNLGWTFWILIHILASLVRTLEEERRHLHRVRTRLHIVCITIRCNTLLQWIDPAYDDRTLGIVVVSPWLQAAGLQ